MTDGNPLSGYIDGCSLQDGNLLLKGWVLHKSQPLSHVSVFVNSTKWAEDVELAEDRPDVRDCHPHLPYSSRCSVRHLAPAGGVTLRDGESVITLVAKRGGEELGAIAFPYVDPAVSVRRPPVPPEHLRRRVHGGAAEVGHFLVVGWRCREELVRHVERHRRIAELERILDWGCGCGRVWRHLANDVPASRLHGCDIDAEAIEWMRDTYRDSTFTRVEHLPPTPYADGFFDLVFGVSVLTHVDEATQFVWLAELERITRSGGLVAASVLGESMAPPGLRERLSAEGFVDLDNPQSVDFAPFSHDAYYRATYHTRAYVEKRWSEYFEILDYVEQGIAWQQDLVVMRKR